MNNTGVIDQFLNVFTQYIDSGFGLVGGDVRWLSTTLIAIDMTLAALFWAMAGEEDILARLIKKTLYVGFFAFVIGNFNNLCKVVYESFSGLGLEASGSTLSAQTLLQPGKLAQVGIDAGKPILAAASSLTGYVSIVTNAIPIFVLLVAWIVVVLSFFVLAIQLFIVLLEFKLTTLAGFVLIPFALFNKTAFLAEKVLGNVVASGVKILVLAVIVGIGSTLFSQFTQGFGSNQPTIEDALSIMLGALALFGLGIFGPGIATGLVSGAPQLGAGAAVGTAFTAGGLGAAAALGAGAAIGAAGSGLGAAARGVSRLSGSSAAPATAAASASNSTSPSGAPAWAQRLQRGARHASRAALHVVRSEGQGAANSVSLDQEERR
jgi:type IV secretion system protein TrbL